MPISGAFRKLIRIGLSEGFQSYGDLNRLSREALDFDLDRKTNETAGLDRAIDALITHVDQLEIVPELIIAARQERPRNAQLRQVSEMLGLSASILGDMQILPATRCLAPSGEPEAIVIASAGMSSYKEFVSKLANAEIKVCSISYEVPGGKTCYGTGCLVGKDLIVTNRHVVEPAYSPLRLSGDQIRVRFDFSAEQKQPVTTCLASTNWLVEASPDSTAQNLHSLDYAVLRLATRAGEELLGKTTGAEMRGFLKPISDRPSLGAPLFILHHPYDQIKATASPLLITMGSVIKVEGHILTHSANTLGGSSGAPIFNSRCDLIAIHHSAGLTGYNESTLFTAIKTDLREKDKEDLI